MAPYFDLNVIVVGNDKFTPVELQRVNDSVAVATAIFAPLGPVVGTVAWYVVNSADSKGLHIIRSIADAQSLADLWEVHNEAIDLFVVIHNPIADGWSPLKGKCPKGRGKNMRSPVVSLNGDTLNSGNTFAHEIGHYLGLPHAEDDSSLVGAGFVANNFMRKKSGSNTEVTQAQSARMRQHCCIKF
ncbi:hypothetical protein H8Z59_27980 [Mycolicibacterium fortuitum]|uniref:zinc-dependent metalloprotease family protein n=1 Tax=Mycolicibacterium fortuitum TaxID=1766 RepID=UPI001CDD4095|nr:zinc-dependent metalloprotease family protein [Mycolicibacterium fortuitum]UBV20989.1 hypothetical protein H8Z59_27980 [Mycolicibacterium fortuitum]